MCLLLIKEEDRRFPWNYRMKKIIIIDYMYIGLKCGRTLTIIYSHSSTAFKPNFIP